MVIGSELHTCPFVEKNFDFSHSGCRLAPICAKKGFGQNGDLPKTFFELFLAPIMYQNLSSNISKIWATLCFRKIISKIVLSQLPASISLVQALNWLKTTPNIPMSAKSMGVYFESSFCQKMAYMHSNSTTSVGM